MEKGRERNRTGGVGEEGMTGEERRDRTGMGGRRAGEGSRRRREVDRNLGPTVISKSLHLWSGHSHRHTALGGCITISAH